MSLAACGGCLQTSSLIDMPLEKVCFCHAATRSYVTCMMAMCICSSCEIENLHYTNETTAWFEAVCMSKQVFAAVYCACVRSCTCVCFCMCTLLHDVHVLLQACCACMPVTSLWEWIHVLCRCINLCVHDNILLTVHMKSLMMLQIGSKTSP